MVAFGVSCACLAYAASLALQRPFPAVAEWLTLTLLHGAQPTYYLRVATSLGVGVLAGSAARPRAISEVRLAWGTAVAVFMSAVLVCAFP